MFSTKILVTGGTGFLGSYLLRYLLHKGYTNVHALKRADSPTGLIAGIEHQVNWLTGDLLDIPALDDAMDGVEQVYHCAAVVSFNESDNRRMMQVNREGTANLVNIALERSINKLVHVSSIAALGRSGNGSLIDEKTKWQNGPFNSPYGVSKHLAEMEVWRGIAEGLNAVIVNPSNVLGSGFWKDRTSTGQLFYKIWKGLPFYPRGGSGFVDVRDVVLFMVLVMESDIAGERYIVNGENLSFKTVFDKIAETLHVKAPSVEVNPFIREVAWRAAWVAAKLTGKPAFITRQTARSSSRTFHYDASKSREAFDFSYTPIAQTIRETSGQFLHAASNGFEPQVLSFHQDSLP